MDATLRHMKTGTRSDEGDVAAVVSLLSADDALGYTVDEIVHALRLSIDPLLLQIDLEELVDRGLLDRRGIGRGALYSLAPSVHGAANTRVGTGTKDALAYTIRQTAG